ncbi:hypothetical protein C1646_765345 [Rhizophagus diaphanus]|nr:hypothetical protein C1646_765345 [Rhizophagus diaphanus] [Rhizophagus sp. MUCL 43196]
MISPVSFKRAQKLKRHLSFARLVLSFSTIRSLALAPLHSSSEPAGSPLNNALVSSITTPYISTVLSTLDKDADAALPVFAVNSGFLSSSTSALSTDNDRCFSYAFTIRTVLDGHIWQNCFTIHTNSPLLFTADPFQFTSDRPSPNFKFILSKFLTFFFYQQNRISSRAQRKCFDRLRQLLLTQRVTSLASTYVMSNFHHTCHIHDKKLIQTPSPPPASPFALPCNHVSRRQEDGYFKELTSRHSSMWMATKEPAVVIPPASYKLTMSTTDASLVLSVRKLISSRPDVSFNMTEHRPKSSIAYIFSSFTGSIQQVVLNPSAIIADNLVLNKPTSSPFVGPNCPTVDQFQTLGLKHPWFEDSSSFSHLWNKDTRFSFKFGRVKPCDILMLFDVCTLWFDSHTYPDPSNPHSLWELPADFMNSASFTSETASKSSSRSVSSSPSVSSSTSSSSMALVPLDSWVDWVSSFIIRSGS